MFDALTTDELSALADALITRRPSPGWSMDYSSNRMANMLATVAGADGGYHTYRDIAREIGTLHGQVVDLFVARMDAR